MQGEPVASASAAVDVWDLQATEIADDESAPADEVWVDVGRAKAVKKAARKPVSGTPIDARTLDAQHTADANVERLG